MVEHDQLKTLGSSLNYFYRMKLAIFFYQDQLLMSPSILTLTNCAAIKYHREKLGDIL